MASSQIGTSNQGTLPKIVEARFAASKPGNPDAAIFASAFLPDRQLILRRSLGLGRSRPSGELLQAIALVPRRSSNCCVVLRQLHRAIGYLQCFRVFLLLIEGQREPEDHHFIRVARVGIDRFLQILFRCRKILR